MRRYLEGEVELVRFLHSLRSVGMTGGGGRSVGMTVGPLCHPDRGSGATEWRDLPSQYRQSSTKSIARSFHSGLWVAMSRSFFLVRGLTKGVGDLWSVSKVSAIVLDDVSAGEGLQTAFGLNHQVAGGVDAFEGP